MKHKTRRHTHKQRKTYRKIQQHKQHQHCTKNKRRSIRRKRQRRQLNKYTGGTHIPINTYNNTLYPEPSSTFVGGGGSDLLLTNNLTNNYSQLSSIYNTHPIPTVYNVPFSHKIN